MDWMKIFGRKDGGRILIGRKVGLPSTGTTDSSLVVPFNLSTFIQCIYCSLTGSSKGTTDSSLLVPFNLSTFI